jgi:hypothetical protein
MKFLPCKSMMKSDVFSYQILNTITHHLNSEWTMCILPSFLGELLFFALPFHHLVGCLMSITVFRHWLFWGQTTKDECDSVTYSGFWMHKLLYVRKTQMMSLRSEMDGVWVLIKHQTSLFPKCLSLIPPRVSDLSCMKIICWIMQWLMNLVSSLPEMLSWCKQLR